MAFERKLGDAKGNNVRAVIDLKELYGKDVLDNPSARQALAADVIDAILERAKAQPGSYSKEYAASLKFKAYGKSKGDVNMRLTGSMLASLDVRSDGRTRIEIGWDEGSEDGKKAHGHITGAVGKKRDFFKVSQKEIKAIASKYEDEFVHEPSDPAQDSSLALSVLQNRSIASLIRRVIE